MFVQELLESKYAVGLTRNDILRSIEFRLLGFVFSPGSIRVLDPHRPTLQPIIDAAVEARRRRSARAVGGDGGASDGPLPPLVSRSSPSEMGRNRREIWISTEALDEYGDPQREVLLS